eukprot:TRINITY_DN15374_c0_g1_i1.p1 TRINITY_DN15374_c0_g1~~TRINITY_DN15374_c0_g1_i1.p1  ORF type:complete len:103 (-),score=20.97 TRINITY_DN15374_c0_g1_i1:114-422(-)
MSLGGKAWRGVHLKPGVMYAYAKTCRTEEDVIGFSNVFERLYYHDQFAYGEGSAWFSEVFEEATARFQDFESVRELESRFTKEVFEERSSLKGVRELVERMD